VIAVGLTLAVTAAAVAAATLGGRAAPAQAASADLASCTNVKIGMMAPLTGPAAFLGQEQLSWVQFAVSNYNKQFRTKFAVAQGDQQLSPDLSRTLARKWVADKSIIGVVGSSISQGVVTTGSLFKAAHLVSVSGSATRTSLTSGQFPTFYRTVPNDSVQGPAMAKYIRNNLKAKKVTVVDSQDDYSVPLADTIEKVLKAGGVTVDRQSVANTETDFSTIVTNVSSDTKIVVFATQTPPAANTLAQQLIEQGKSARVFGTDGSYAPAQFKPKNGYASVFAEDLHFDSKAKSIVAAYNKFSRNKTFGAFGPPSYMAAWAILNAAHKACADDSLTRAEVLRNVHQTNVPSIQGGRLSFTAKGDPTPAKFWFYKITSGKYSPLGAFGR
jgi:branched-chain amino acid transport system substrate-binding protein